MLKLVLKTKVPFDRRDNSRDGIRRHRIPRPIAQDSSSSRLSSNIRTSCSKPTFLFISIYLHYLMRHFIFRSNNRLQPYLVSSRRLWAIRPLRYSSAVCRISLATNRLAIHLCYLFHFLFFIHYSSYISDQIVLILLFFIFLCYHHHSSIHQRTEFEIWNWNSLSHDIIEMT